MKKFFLLIVITFFLVACGQNKVENKSVFEKEIIDGLGQKHQFEKTPQRIISLAPSLTEIIYALGVENQLVGNTNYCNYPEPAKKITKVGNLISVDFEKILQLKPDLILISTEGNTKEMADKLNSIGIEYFVANPKSFASIKTNVLKIATIFGKEKKAEILIEKWNREIDSVKLVAQKAKPKKAMFLLSIEPLILVGRNTFINEMMEICNLQNIATKAMGTYPTFSREDVLKYNPDYIFVARHAGINFANVNKAYPEWKRLKAVQNDNVVILDSDLFARPGPRFTLAVKTLFNAINN